MSLTASDSSAGFVYYVDDITFTNENAIPPEIPFSTNYADFENGDLSKYDGKGCTIGEIGEVAHSGEKSLKLTSGYNYSLFSFSGLDEALKEAVAEGYGKVSFWIYVESDKDITYPVWNLSSFCLYGLCKESGLDNYNNLFLWKSNNSWYCEAQWDRNNIKEYGVYRVNNMHSMARALINNTGSWSTKEFLPMGCIEDFNKNTFMVWQLECGGSWNCEVSACFNEL